MINKQLIQVNVLDHGFVRMRDYMGDDHAIVCAARVIEEAWRGDKDIGLLKYLLEHKHTSPFEHVVFKFHIKAPIFVFRQWHRHRTWSYNEESARYKVLPNEYYVPKPEHIGMQSTSNHQGREMVSIEEAESKHNEEAYLASQSIELACAEGYAAYEQLLRGGVPREIARGVLPVNMYSEMYATVDAHNLMHFLRLRLDSHAQYEIRVYAEALLKCMAEVIPVTTNIFLNSLEAQNG